MMMIWLLDANKFLPLLVEFWCCLGLFQIARRFRYQRKTSADAGLAILIAFVTTTAAIVLVPAVAAPIALGTWLLLVTGPNLAARAVGRIASRRRFRRAEIVSSVLRVLRPLGNWDQARQFFRALRWLSEGHRHAGLGLLARIENSGSDLSDEARAERLATEANWELLLGMIDRYRNHGFVPSPLLPRYFRALGELGRADELVRSAATHADTLFASPQLLPQSLLMVFAFAGRVELVKRLMVESLRYVDATTREAWIATAELAGDEFAAGRARLERCSLSADAEQLLGIERRLAAPPPPASESLGVVAQRQVDELAARWTRTQRYVPGHGPACVPWASAAIVALLVAVFVAEEALGGSMNPATLELLGALVPERAAAGEWWRVFTALFLHMGLLHLLMNSLALLVLGPYVERRVGPLRLTLLFLASGGLPMLVHVLLAWIGDAAPSVGASGGVMGLLGASAALLVQGYFERGVAETRRFLRLVIVLVITQTSIDLVVPIVDFLGHSLGLASGFLLGAVLIRLNWRKTLAIAVPAFAFALGMQSVLAELPWRTPPCSDGETALCRQICELGVQEACTELGLKYMSGQDVVQDLRRARSLLEPACDASAGRACALLGILVYDEDGGADHARGIELLAKGCRLGIEGACGRLTSICKEEDDARACLALESHD